MRWAAALVFVLGFTLTAASAQTFQLLAEDSAGLWGQANGTGAGNDLVRAAYGAVGARVEFSVAPYKRAKTLVLAGLALGCFGMSKSPDLGVRVVFPKNPLYANTSILFFRTADGEKYRTLADLKGPLTVGTVLGYEYPVEFYDLVARGTFLVEETGSEVQNLKKLAQGRIDAAVANVDELKGAGYLIGEAGAVGKVVVGPVIGASQTYIGFAARDPGTPEAVALFDRGMELIRKDGTANRILSRWRAILTTTHQ